MNNKQSMTVALIALMAAVLTSNSATAGREKATSAKLDFNRGWTFVKSNAQWTDDFTAEGKAMAPVTLPHTWNEIDMLPGAKDPYIAAGWYRKSFAAPKLQPDQRLLVEFEGVNNFHRVWVNSGYAGGRDGGFLTSLLDITDLLDAGDNTILVRADNSYKLEAAMPLWIGWNRYGGITRPVWLHVREHAFIACAGVEIRTPQVSAHSAATVVHTHVEETTIGGTTLDIRHTLTSPAGKVVSTTTTPMKTRYCFTNTIEVKLPAVKRPQLWSDVSPVLYTLLTEIVESGKVIDSHQNRIGYRFFSFDSEKGFTLNGKPTKLRGANIHIFFPGLGNALPQRFHLNDMKLMKRMGCNFMRTSHYPRPKATLDACDELGILVMEEQPYWHGSVRASGGEEAIDTASRLIRDMVRQHGSHPCIIAWNTVNEIMIAPSYKPGVGHLPPGHPDRAAWRINPKEYPYLRRHLQKMVDTLKEVDPDRPVSMVVGGQWEKNDVAGLTSIADIVAYNGGALNMPAGKFTGPKTGKNYEFKPDYYRQLYPNRIQIMSEGILNFYSFSRGQWDKEQAAWRVSAKYWSLINQHPWFCGGSMWCFTDYGQNSVLDLHGAVDRFRLPKDIFYFYEAMWADHPVLFIQGHWNHQAGSPREVVLFTNCKNVELTLNGKSLGKGVSCTDKYPAIPNAPLIWKNVAFEAGTLEAAGKFGKQKIVDRRKTAGKPAKVALVASNDLIADGRDISYIDLTICDADGNRCYTTDSRLSLAVSGPAHLGGPEKIDVSAGLARVAIRSTGHPGDIKVVATGRGLSSGQLKLKAYRRPHLDFALALPPVDVCAEDNQLRIMPLGDSITAGYTDNPKWKHPFEFGYRSGLYRRLKNAGYDFIFVGGSGEPFDNKFGDPTHGGTVSPKLDLGKLNQDGHRGYGGWGINSIQKNVAMWIKQDRPDIILLLIGINGINANSSQKLDALVKTIYDTDKNVKIVVAQITPLKTFNQNLFDYNTYIRRTLLPAYAARGYAISTIDLYKHFLTDPNDPKSIDPTRLSNSINHPTNALYDKMAQSWFQGIKNFKND